jgi:hypothetical protein
MTNGSGATTRVQALIFAALLIVCTAATIRAVFFDPSIPFVTRSGDGEWIAPPIPFTTNLIAVDPSAPPVFTFVKRFDADGAGQSAVLRGRAVSELRLSLNGQSLPTASGRRSWKQPFEIDVSGALREGRNELRAAVGHGYGPPLLQLRLALGNRNIETDASWQVVPPRGNPVAAVLASDTAPHPQAHFVPEPGQILRERATIVLLLFVGGALGAFVYMRSATPRVAERLPAITLGTMTGFWLLLFVSKLSRMPLLLGFDAMGHLHNIDHLVEHGAISPPGDGFSSYHPPVFYLFASAFVGLTGVTQESGAGQLVYRLVPFACGLANVWLTYVFARRLWPGEPLRPSLAVATAGLLPMNLYMSAYVSNEAMHGMWISLACVLTAVILQRPDPTTRQQLGLGTVLGLGLLTKFTSLMLAPIFAGFVALRALVTDRADAPRVAQRVAIILGTAAVISSWFYLRNWIVYDNPFVWNLNVPGAPTWWMLPGFHTADYYLDFGDALRHPYFAGFSSFWDGFYSTLWGDGLVAGMIELATRHRFWNYDFMTLTYWLAFPASLLMLAGFAKTVRDSFTRPEPEARWVRSLITTLLSILVFSLFFITLRLPFYAQVKAPYVLAAVLPLSIVSAEGLAWLPRQLTGPHFTIVRVAYAGWLTTLAGTIVLAFLG